MNFKNIFTILVKLLIIIWLIGLIILFLPPKTLLMLNLFVIKDRYGWIIGPFWVLISFVLFIELILSIGKYLNNFQDKIKNTPSFVLLLGVTIIFFSSILLKIYAVKIDIQSITSFLSVCVAAWSFYITNSENRRNKEQSQAAKVSCWLLPGSKKDEYEFKRERNKDGGFYFVPRRVNVENGSRLPLYDIFIFSMNNKDNDDIKTLYHQFLFARYIGLIPPGKSTLYVKTGGSAMGGTRSRAAMIFRDSNLQWWYRGPQGSLSRIRQKDIDKLISNSGIYYPLIDGSIYENNFLRKDNFL